MTLRRRSGAASLKSSFVNSTFRSDDELDPIRSARKGTPEFERVLEIGYAIAVYLYDHDAPKAYTGGNTAEDDL